MTGSPALEVRLLGRFVMLRDGHEVPTADFGGRKVRALLRILLTRRGAFVSHDLLTEMLWGDRPPADPAANLQVLVNRARRALGVPDLLITGPRGYSFAADPRCDVDAEDFLAAINSAEAASGRQALEAYRRALRAWSGTPLAEDSYADWAADYRSRLTRARQAALERAAVLALQLGDDQTAVGLSAEAAALEPLREIAVLTLIRALAATGDRVAALDRFAEYRRTLADELGLDPSEEAEALQTELLNGRTTSGRTSAQSSVSSGFERLPFVGRDSEIDSLAAAALRPGTVLLHGPSGMGKSRLLEVLSTLTRIVGVRAFSAERDDPWSLARSVVREVLAHDAAVTEDLPDSIRAALGWLVPELGTGYRAVADPESRKALLSEALVRMVGRIDCPLVIDDLQWADSSSLAVVGAALDRLETMSVVLAYRDEARERGEVAALVDHVRGRVTEIALGPLTVGEVAELTTDPALAASLASQTDGTPLAVAEVLRALAAEGAIARATNSRWRPASEGAVERAGVLAVEGQRRAIALRTEAHAPLAREVLRLLSLLVREVPAGLIAQATGTPQRLVLDALATLSASGLARLDEQGWATGHDMVSEVVADGLASSERGRLHALLAEALDATGADAGELAQHWLGAGELPRAAEAYLRAATQALNAFANDEAASLATAGLSLSTSGAVGSALNEVRAEARARTGDLVGARDDLRAALQSLPRGPSSARVLGQLATLASGSDDLRRAAELAELALVEAGDAPEAKARSLEIAAVLDMNLDRPDRSETRAAEALTLYQQIGDARGTARILDGRAMATFLDGQIASGALLLERVADLFEDSGDLIRVITPRSTAGHAQVFGGDPARGLALAGAALELARTVGNREGESYSQWHTSEALSALGRSDEAVAFGTDALAVAERIGHRGWSATAWRAIGIANQGAGDLEVALAAFRTSLELSENLNLFACWAASRIALVLIAAGRIAEAEPFVARALVEGPPLGRYEARLAEVELAAARGDDGLTALAQAALRLADADGMVQHRQRLVELAVGQDVTPG